MLKAGSAIPDVTVPPTPGLCDRPTPLAELAAAGPIVLYSYPADGTPMCTRQACAMRDVMGEMASELEASGVRVVGVSPQGEQSHERFRERHHLPFPIIADPDKHVLRAIEAIGLLGMPRRVTYLLSPDGTIARAIAADLKLSRHKQFLRDVLSA